MKQGGGLMFALAPLKQNLVATTFYSIIDGRESIFESCTSVRIVSWCSSDVSCYRNVLKPSFL